MPLPRKHSAQVHPLHPSLNLLLNLVLSCASRCVFLSAFKARTSKQSDTASAAPSRLPRQALPTRPLLRAVAK